MRPYPPAVIAGTTALVRTNGAVSVDVDRPSPLGDRELRAGGSIGQTPRCSRGCRQRPNRPASPRQVASGTPSAAMSPGIAIARSPRDCATDSARLRSRTLIATAAPRSYRRCAIARPRPRAAPVTIATRPEKSSNRIGGALGPPGVVTQDARSFRPLARLHFADDTQQLGAWQMQNHLETRRRQAIPRDPRRRRRPSDS